MIKTDSSGKVVGFSLSDLKDPGNLEFFKSGISSAERRMKENFAAQTFELRNLYINKLNSIACGMPVRPVPWNESTDENDIQEILKQHPEYQLDYDLELYEEKMLSMGLDPTEGMFKQFPPGTPVLSSSNGRHLAYMEERKAQEGLNIPELENFMMGVTRDNDPELANTINNTMSDQQLQESLYAQAVHDRYQLNNAIGMPPMLPNGQFNFDALNVPFGKTVPLLPVPQRLYSLSSLVPPRNIDDEMKDESIPYEERLAIYNAMVKYIEEYNNYIKGAFFESQKQVVYNQIRELMDQRNLLVNTTYSMYMQPQVRERWVRDIANIDLKIQELQATVPVYPQDDFTRYEQSILEYNYQVQKYNNNKLRYEQYKLDEAARNNPSIVNFITFDELFANGCYMNLETKEWFDRFGRPLNREKAMKMDELNRLKNMAENEMETNKRRNEYVDNMFMINGMIKDAVKFTGGTPEDAEEIIKNDPFGMMYNLDYNPYYQTSSTWERFNRRVNNQYDVNYDPETGKNIDELTPEELDRFTKRVELRARNARASMVRPLTEEQILAIANSRGVTRPDGTIRLWRMRAPLTVALDDVNEKRAAHPYESGDINNLFNTFNEVYPAYQYSIAHERPRDLSGFYNHSAFNDTIENFVHKTRIGRTSDLLNELDDNAEFAKAMNNGILGLSLPNEIGYNYNKRRVDFDNSILNQLIRVGKPLPEGAKIKDPETETYNDMPLSEIQKERYGLTMDRAEKLKQYFSPELGGTWNAAAVNDN